MRARALRSFAACVALTATAVALFAAESLPVAPGPVVELPPMIIAETVKSPPWLYAKAGDMEFLSRCSQKTTQAFIAAQLASHRALRGLVPPEFLAKNAVPLVALVVPLEPKKARDDAVLRALLNGERTTNSREPKSPDRNGAPPSSERFEFLPNQRIDDRDMMAVFTFINESDFDSRRVIVADEFVRALLTRRTPMLPSWLIEGVIGLYQQTTPRSDPVVLRPFIWLSRDDSIGLLRDPASRRTLLPCNELFAPDAVPGPNNQHAVRSAVWRAQTALFIRWTLDPTNAPARDALWKLVERVSREPMTEKIFTEYFGFGYSDLLDRLSDYLPVAVKTPVPIALGNVPPSPRFEISLATPSQITRLRGEWERLEIPYVRVHHPKFVAHYIDQARTTLLRADDHGERDPQLLAATGLCELDAGNTVTARPLLEAAGAAHVVRPRVYLEIARLRLADLTRDSPETRRFTAAQLQPILEPLHQAIAQQPPLADVYLLTLDAWLRCNERTPSAELAVLVKAAPLFRRHPGFALRLALLQIKNDQPTEAAATLSTALEFLPEPATRSRYQQVLATLVTPTRAP